MRSKAALAVVVFLMALLARVLDLDVFQSWDEKVIWKWSNGFFLALYSGDLIETANNGYPAVVLMWVQTIGAWLKYLYLSLMGQTPDLEQLLGVGSLPFSLLVERRWYNGVTNALLVTGIWWFTDRLFGRRVGLASAILIALNPFLLTDSRVVRVEGMTTGLLTISLLTLLLYLKENQARFLLLSAIFTGLSVANKVAALALLPYGAGLISIKTFLASQLTAGKKFQRWVITGFLWGVGIILTIWIIWPAMWLAPLEPLKIELAYLQRASSSLSATIGGGKVFFMGESLTRAPGPAFYPLILAFRSTPLAWLGTIACLVVVLLNRWRPSTFYGAESGRVGRESWYVVALAGFILFYVLVLDQGFSKWDRYTIPVFPSWDILAGWGLVYLLIGLEAGLKESFLKRHLWKVGLAGLLLSQLALTLPHHPYYYTYWNPLLGGGQQAKKFLPVGAGEGVDLVITYLNQQPDGSQLTMVCGITQPDFCADTFQGETLKMQALLDGSWPEADYIMLYLFEIQRQRYPPEVVSYIKAHWSLAETFTLNGVDYAWLYQRPAGWVWSGETLVDKARLLVAVLPDTLPPAGEALDLRLLWQNKGLGPTDQFLVSLVDTQGYEWSRTQVPFTKPEANRTIQRVIETPVSLPLPAGMPPGLYRLVPQLYDTLRQEMSGQFRLNPDRNRLVIDRGRLQSPAPLDELGMDRLLDQKVTSALTLVGFDMPPEQTLLAGQENWLAFYWQVEEKMSQDYRICLDLINPAGESSLTDCQQPVYGQFTTSQWPANQPVIAPWPLDIPQDLPASDYTLELSLPGQTASAQSFSLGKIRLQDRQRRQVIPPVQHQTDALWGDFARLVGYDMGLVPDDSGGGKLVLTLYWQSEAANEIDYNVVVNVVDEAGQVVLSRSNPPDYGQAPTGSWQPGEVIFDTHELNWQNPQPGQYRITLALQQPETGETLTVVSEDTPSAENRLLLTTLDLQ